MRHLFFSLHLLLLPHAAFASEPPAEKTDLELQELRQELHKLRQEELNTEIEGQAYFRYDSPTYTKKMERAEARENAAKRLEERIDELEARKKDSATKDS